MRVCWEGERGLEAAMRYAQMTASRIALKASAMVASSTGQHASETSGKARAAIKTSTAGHYRKDERQKALTRIEVAGDVAVTALNAWRIGRRKYRDSANWRISPALSKLWGN